jgi:beta-galactosidase GanA
MLSNLLRRLATGVLLLSPAILAQNSTNSTWPVQNNGYQDVVEWDHYSLLIDSERYFLFSGEFHPFRIPVPELWEDILQKVKALGMRMISVYLHWGFHAPDADTLDFETAAHNIERFFEMARDIGLYVQVRPGPYINAETNAGGLPPWVITGEYGTTLRTNSTAWTEAWTPYQTFIAQLVQRYQVTENGTVLLYQIENEDSVQWSSVSAKTPSATNVAYFKLLEANARDNGIVIPTIHNAANMNGKSWSTDYDTVGAGGDVDITGLDSYVSAR